MKVPVYVGWYQPHSRDSDYDGTMPDPVTGELKRAPLMTKQEFKDECDINNIIREYSTTGQINHINARAAEGAFTDLPEAMDFQESIAIVERASAAFSLLPSRVRDRFGNDPQGFLDFVGNPANLAEMRELGLAAPEVDAQAPGSPSPVASVEPTPPPKA